jgi:hypothetical protein
MALSFSSVYALSLGPLILVVLLICARLIHGNWTSAAFGYPVIVERKGKNLGQRGAELALIR